jgi:hypothetical protein
VKLKIETVWVVDPLVVNLDISQPPQLHVSVNQRMARMVDEVWTDPTGIEWSHTKLSPFRGYWMRTEAVDVPLAPYAHRVNKLDSVTRPLARVFVHEPGYQTTIWFLDLDHAMRICRKQLENTHMAVWPTWAREGVMEWAPQDIMPTCKWPVMIDNVAGPCGSIANYSMGGRPLALCSTHKSAHDEYFAYERNARLPQKGASRNG